MTIRITAIRFTAKWTEQLGSDSRLLTALPKIGTAEFSLGRGPCGKTVDSLRFYSDRDYLSIRQTHDDGTEKRFLYRNDDIMGRVEVEYGPSE